MLVVQVRNETTDDFLELLKEWEKLCKTYPKPRNKVKSRSNVSTQSSSETTDCSTIPPEEFEVWKLVDICFGDPNGVRNRGLYFKVCNGSLSLVFTEWQLNYLSESSLANRFFPLYF